jgi:hypothetical protein
MTASRKLGFLLLLAAFALGDFAPGNRSSITGIGGWSLISTARAEVGRPLTPVSVAGVARRTARRCAAGVYDC